MASIGKVTAALASASNENTLALVNNNVDFTLIKYPAPVQFRMVGEALTQRRREEAEEGSLHRTARKLGSLFYDQVPSTPKLIAAYGTRSSEIAAVPDINRKGTFRHGPFQPFVGIDGTSLWAAATSQSSDEAKHAPLAMHMLACVLARAFDTDLAVSLWVELVEMRRRELSLKLNAEHMSINTWFASKQEITRDHLASWDASARAWLTLADNVKRKEFTQFDLLIRNLHLEFANMPSTYESVMEVWHEALTGIEKSLSGVPQDLSESMGSSILLAMSSWHLYPDLIVLRKHDKKIAFQDSLFGPSSAITIGLQFERGTRAPGLHWSLALSHLKYYGGPVKVESQPHMRRTTVAEVVIMAFGNLLWSWKVPCTASDEVACAEWILSLKALLLQGQVLPVAMLPGYHFGWLGVLADGAEGFLKLHESEPKACSALISWGRRRCRDFLGSAESTPFFGIHHLSLHTTKQITNSREMGIHFLRGLAIEAGFKPEQAVIRFIVKESLGHYVEMVTAVPHNRYTLSKPANGRLVSDVVHCRWIGLGRRSRTLEPMSNCDCDSCGDNCPCAVQFRRCRSTCHSAQKSKPHCMVWGHWTTLRFQDIERCGEKCITLNSGQANVMGWDTDLNASSSLNWYCPPQIYDNDYSLRKVVRWCLHKGTHSNSCHCFDIDNLNPRETKFRLVCGTLNGLGLFVRNHASTDDDNIAQITKSIQQVTNRGSIGDNRTEYAQKPLQIGQLSVTVVVHLMEHIAKYNINLVTPQTPSSRLENPNLTALWKINPLPDKYLRCLTLLSYASGLYAKFNEVAISNAVFKTSLDQSHWLVHSWTGEGLDNDSNPNSYPDSGSDSDSDDYELCTGQSVGALGRGAPRDYEEMELRPAVLRRQRGSRFTMTFLSRKVDTDFKYPRRPLYLHEMFACIASFESGTSYIKGEICEPVIAMASVSSLFISSALLDDPSLPDRNSIRQVIGNIGKSGISMLVLPQEPPRLRSLGYDWRAVPHCPYDGRREDSFQSTSLVLSFTDWKRPVHGASRGRIDETLNFVECFISVHDRDGKWVADLDPLKTTCLIRREDCACSTNNNDDDNNNNKNNVEATADEATITSIDSWEELLDAPDNYAVFRARGNWVARLSAAAIRTQQGHEKSTYIISSDSELCTRCLSKISCVDHESERSQKVVIID